MLSRRIIAIDVQHSFAVEGASVAHDIQIAVAIDVTETQTVIDRGGRLVFDAPLFVCVNELASARATQQPEKVAPIPNNVRNTVVIEISDNGKSPRSVIRLARRLHSADGVGLPGEMPFAIIDVNRRSLSIHRD